MTDHVPRIVTSLRHQHDQLAAAVPQLGEDQLTGPSGASEWSVADVLSHLGSGAEITRATILASVDDSAEAPDNQAIWDRWNAASPRDQAADFLDHDARLVELLEGFSDAERETMRIDMGFLPEPVPLEVAAGMRLNEVSAHQWDVAAGLDPAAGMDPEAAELLLDLYAGPLAFLLGFSSQPDQLSERVELGVDERAVVIDDAVAVRPAGSPTATFTGDPEAAVRLLSGRLRPPYTPEGLEVSGNVTLDQLRAVFPGY
ncbi:maleylpyruvate isomerase family mycothiol-dependent enzyme [Nocardioides lijunqiniae]|uniref:maleylpyruvate isomerase family mycothiol-dependent enzyme n=1 Tax=Nocardioides lijunqiniae TaxID=2760832 RepID=UPI0018786A66|nr:maleylpyruvate isomerase family mycothiol-dependent enzyme [Nocardioides lijunqiniae]